MERRGLRPAAYFVGVAAIIVFWHHSSRRQKCLQEIRLHSSWNFRAYHLPTVGNVLRSMWERGWSFIKKAGTIILLSINLRLVCRRIFGVVDGQFHDGG